MQQHLFLLVRLKAASTVVCFSCMIIFGYMVNWLYKHLFFIDSFLRLIFHKAVKKTVHRIFYTSPGQRYSVANYWNDPHHQAGYIKSSKYLPYIDNIIPTARNNDYKINFLRLKKLILIGGPDDGVITPWQSRFYYPNLYFINML